MKTLNETQTAKAIELLKQASGLIDVLRFEEGEEIDEDDFEGEINSFLKSVEGTPETKPFRITIGEDNCRNDIPIEVRNSLPDIATKIDSSFMKGNYVEMIEHTERLLRVAKDLNDMAHELNND